MPVAVSTEAPEVPPASPGRLARLKPVIIAVIALAIVGLSVLALSRLLSGVVYDIFGRDFPWGTAAVNILGCFLFGLVWELGEDRMLMRTEARVIFLTGFMGAFTTFSTFIFESGNLLEDGRYLALFANLSLQSILGFAALFAGLALGRLA